MALWFWRPLVGTHPDLRNRVFGLLGATGMLLAVAAAAASLFIDSSRWQLVGNALAFAFAYLMLLWVRRTGRYAGAYLVTVIVVFLGLFPLLFWTGGGAYSGMPVFFVFAIVFTVFMLDGKRALLLGLIELVVYAGLIAIGYHRPDLVPPLGTRRDFAIDMVFAMTATAAALGTVLFLVQRAQLRGAKQLALQNQALEQASLAKTEFLNTVAHELNTPLAVLRGHAQEQSALLEARDAGRGVGAGGGLGGPGGGTGGAEGQGSTVPAGSGSANAPTSDAEVARALRRIADEADRMGLLVAQLLDLSRIEQGRLPVEPRAVDLSAIVQEVLGAYAPLLAGQGNTLELARGGAAPVVLADRDRVAQVLVNLLANAARHTQDGTVTVSVSQAHGWAEVAVADTGEGIPPEVLEHLFERTSPSDSPPSAGRSRGGSGLGLIISRHLIEAHGGRLTITSVPDEGTTCRFTLPLSPDDAATCDGEQARLGGSGIGGEIGEAMP
ncbi:MAG: HAMP domain-containing histidine kinase [Bifidobacteriaceae bacterium]|nr:HAMP domain-containing histidine kinase [Bifidobacteriaceae bacterium]